MDYEKAWKQLEALAFSSFCLSENMLATSYDPEAETFEWHELKGIRDAWDRVICEMAELSV